MYTKLVTGTQGTLGRGFRSLCTTFTSPSIDLAQVIHHGANTYNELNSIGGPRVNPIEFYKSLTAEIKRSEHNFQQRQNLFSYEDYESNSVPGDYGDYYEPINPTEPTPQDEPGILKQAYEWLKQREDNILALAVTSVADMRATASSEASKSGHKVAEFKVAFNNALIESAFGQVVAGKMDPAVFAAINKFVVQRFTDPIMTRIFNHFAVNGQISPELEAKILENPNTNLMIAAIILMVVVKILYDQFTKFKKDMDSVGIINYIGQYLNLIDAQVNSPVLENVMKDLERKVGKRENELAEIDQNEDMLKQLKGYIDELEVQRSQAWFSTPQLTDILAEKNPDNVRDIKKLIRDMGISGDDLHEAKLLITDKQGEYTKQREVLVEKLKNLKETISSFSKEGKNQLETISELHKTQEQLESKVKSKNSNLKDQLSEHKQEDTKQEIYEEDKRNELRS